MSFLARVAARASASLPGAVATSARTAGEAAPSMPSRSPLVRFDQRLTLPSFVEMAHPTHGFEPSEPDADGLAAPSETAAPSGAGEAHHRAKEPRMAVENAPGAVALAPARPSETTGSRAARGGALAPPPSALRASPFSPGDAASAPNAGFHGVPSETPPPANAPRAVPKLEPSGAGAPASVVVRDVSVEGTAERPAEVAPSRS